MNPDKQVEEIFKEVFGISEIADDLSVENFPPWDSLRHIQLILTIERMTGKIVTPLEATELNSVRKIRHMLQKA